jgi:ribosome biogenesis GTPase
VSGAADLIPIGWHGDDALPTLHPGQRLARVIEQYRNRYTIHDGESPRRASSARGMVLNEKGEPMRPAVGDWVIVEDAEPVAMKRLLPRRNVLRRAAAGELFREQVLAVNLDLAIVVMGLDGDYNPRRLERYLALIASARIPALVVLSKADRFEATPERLAEIRTIAADAGVFAINCKDPLAVAPIAQRLTTGQTVILLGSSGAGKSTLTNTLMGEIKQKTNEVRAHDSRGRHTTTMRSLLKLPGGGCLIDSPGMRELKLTGDESLEDDRFADIEALAANCRFSDCRHESEPGCAVLAAIDAGKLDADRVAQLRKLAAERDATAAHRLAQQRKAEEKTLSRALNQRLTEKYGRR